MFLLSVWNNGAKISTIVDLETGINVVLLMK